MQDNGKVWSRYDTAEAVLIKTGYIEEVRYGICVGDSEKS
jgi:hypothetical protein